MGVGSAMNRYAVPAAVALLALTAIDAGIPCLRAAAERAYVGDFPSYYYAAMALTRGEDPYSLEVLARLAAADGYGFEPFAYLYPPLFALLFVPLTLLPLHTAYLVWSALSLGATVAAVPLLWWAVDGGRPALVAASALVAVYGPLRQNLVMGQCNAVLLLLIAVGLLALARRQQVGGGLALGLATAIKMSPGLLLVLALFNRRYRAAAMGLATAAVVGLGAVLPLDPALAVRFVARVFPRFISGGVYHELYLPVALPTNHSLAGLVASLVPGPSVIELGTAATVIVLATGTALMTLGVTVALRARDPRPVLAVGVVLMLILPLNTWEHHLILALPALVWLLGGLCAGRLPRWIVVVTAASALWLAVPETRLLDLLRPLGLVAVGKLPGLLGLFAAVAAAAEIQRDSAPDRRIATGVEGSDPGW
jgi:hypothetical protein